MEHRLIGPGPYRATKLWNETIELFRAGMPQKRHRVHFKTYEKCFTASEAVDWLHELLQCNQNFGPEVTRAQTIQLLKKFQKNHVIEDVKGRWGKEDFEDNGGLYRFPPTSPLKPYPKRPPPKFDPLPFPRWSDEDSHGPLPVKPLVMNSEMWYKRHSIAIGEVPACRLVHRRELTAANIEDIWKSKTLSCLQKIMGLESLNDVMDTKKPHGKHIMHNVYTVNKQGIVVMEDRSKELPHWLLSAMKCLANCQKVPFFPEEPLPPKISVHAPALDAESQVTASANLKLFQAPAGGLLITARTTQRGTERAVRAAVVAFGIDDSDPR